MSNLDKYIEILKDMKGFFSDCEVCTDDCDEKTCVYLRAIENVLSELNKYQEAYKILVNLNSNLKSELETYKKMADLMAKQINNYDAQLVINRFRSKEEVLDWAKSEVLKNE